MRWNLVLGSGEQSAERFLRRYCVRCDTNYVHHPHWDLRCVVDLLPDDGSDDGLANAELTRLEPCVARILARC